MANSNYITKPKHQRIAKILRNAYMPVGTREALARSLSDYFMEENQFFDRKAFMETVMTGDSETHQNALLEHP